MKRIGLFSFAVAILLASCGETINKDKYTIAGKLPDIENDGQQIYLQKMGDTRKDRVNLDTVMIENGMFMFDGVIENGPVVRFVTLSDPKNNILKSVAIVLEPGKIELTIDSTYTVSGTQSNEKFQGFLNDLDNAEKADNEELFKTTVYDFTKTNIANPIGEYSLISYGYALNGEQLKEVLGMAKPEFKESKAGQVAVERSNKLEATAIGKHFTDLKGKTAEGKDIALSDYAGKGKYVLVDFWASWCPPCRKEMPLLVEAYAKYKNKGFEIVGVSIDDNAAAWQKGIKDLKITWPQMSDLKGWKSELSRTYGLITRLLSIIITENIF